ncbi:O-antigen ligase family protein [Lapidilactobacillus mulanensis]|uniref:O-antigen ligase family protein n=1 Tax=Lapidilactobacillus mulanensis TaxID=2485999 RepID=A0ABW4DPZ2_9LACO|nr:O-antigen ligase family protein [Lapidilactobacillus mulanensis]
MKSKQLTKFEKYLLYVFFFELFAGGGGRILAVGPISIRQLLFVGILAIFSIRFIVNRETRKELISYFVKPFSGISLVSILMVLWIGISSIIGIINHHPVGAVLTDTLRVVFVITIVPLAYYIGKNRFTKEDLLKTLLIASLATSILTIVISLIGKTMNGHDFYYFYKFINQAFPGDLFFRPSRGVFYKSHFLVLFALIICFINLIEKKSSRLQNVTIILSVVSIVLSETRGLYIGFAVGLLTYILVKVIIYFFGQSGKTTITRRTMIRQIVLLIVAFAFTGYFFENSTISRFSDQDDFQTEDNGSRGEQEGTKVNDVSMNVRLDLLKDSVNLVEKSKLALLIGNGYGTKIGKRTTGIEMTFVDILVEQGVIGALIWLMFSLLPLYYYFRGFLLSRYIGILDIGLLGSSLAMIVVTNINPFLNSPIGLGFLIPVIVISFKSFRSYQSAVLEETD